MLLLGCSDVDSDAYRFRHENEILNGQVSADGENIHRALSIPVRNPFVFIDGYETFNIISGGTGIIYMGFPECPWCRALLPALMDAVQESRWRGNIYHYNGRADRDVLRLEYGEIVVVEEGAPVYHALVELLFDYLGPYLGLEDDNIRRIYFPTTVFVQDGEISSVHLGTIPEHTIGWHDLSEEQYNELVASLVEQIRRIQ